MIKLFGILFILILSSQSWAQFIDINAFSFSDSFKSDENTVHSRSIVDLGIGTLMGKSDSMMWGISYGSSSFVDQMTATTSTFTITDIGIKFGLFWTKQKSFFNTITYNIQSNAKYNDGTNTVDLRGTSIKFDLGYSFWPSETLGIAFKIVYYAPSFKESVASGSLTLVNYSRSLVYPVFNLIVSY